MGGPSSYWFHVDRLRLVVQSNDSQGGTQMRWTAPHYNLLLLQCHWQRVQDLGTPGVHKLDIIGYKHSKGFKISYSFRNSLPTDVVLQRKTISQSWSTCS